MKKKNRPRTSLLGKRGKKHVCELHWKKESLKRWRSERKKKDFIQGLHGKKRITFICELHWRKNKESKDMKEWKKNK
jgi:hypothetical protein